MICILSLAVFSILGIFSAKYRDQAKKAFKCVFQRVQLKPCETGLDKEVKSKVTGKIFKKNKKVGSFVHAHFEALSWIFTIVLFSSFLYSAYGAYNLVEHGTCNPGGECVISPDDPNKVECPFSDYDVKNYTEATGKFKKVEGEESEPIAYFFGSTWCPHCNWERPIFVNVTSKFGEWKNLEEDDLSSAEFESQHLEVHAVELDKEKDSEHLPVFKHYSDGSIPLIVIGGNYYRTGAGEKLGKEKEKEVLTELLCKVTDNKPEKTCQAK